MRQSTSTHDKDPFPQSNTPHRQIPAARKNTPPAHLSLFGVVDHRSRHPMVQMRRRPV
jgi:hypothetical protein